MQYSVMYCSDFLSNLQYFWNKADQDFRKLSMVSRISEKGFWSNLKYVFKHLTCFWKHLTYALVNCSISYITMERSTMLFMGKSTISTGPFFKRSYFLAKSKDLQILATQNAGELAVLHQECTACHEIFIDFGLFSIAAGTPDIQLVFHGFEAGVHWISIILKYFESCFPEKYRTVFWSCFLRNFSNDMT